MKIHFLGTCSGTEPKVGMHHCSLIMEVNGLNYWFDAGECCVHTAVTSGVDVMKTRALFVSHPHLDHTGGLANLFACINKLASRRFGLKLVHENTLPIYFPDMDILNAIKIVWGGGKNFTLEEHRLSDGLVFEDENIRVTAVHNRHMNDDPAVGWRSFSFLVETEGKRIIFSGDVKAPEELDALHIEGADLLIMETGHHQPEDVCQFAAARKIRKLRFNHHGRTILNNRPAVEKLVADYAAKHEMSIKICYDGMVEEF